VPPGSHEPEALLAPIHRWKQDPTALLELPRFDKTLRRGDGDRIEPWRGPAEVLLLEGWFVGCRPLPRQGLEDQLQLRDEFTPEQCRWTLRCNEALAAYQPLWAQLNQLVMLWPLCWTSPRRWRFQAEARQRRSGGGWMDPKALNNLVQASLQSLPAELHQRDVLSRADLVRVLDGRRRSVWEGSGSAALHWLDQPQPSVSSSATG
jgi:D-glycerate 3-kinase